MPILRYTDATNHLQEKTFTKPIYIGTAPRAATSAYESLTLPPDPYVRPEHAVITRSEITLKPVLIDLCGHNTRVNGVPIQNIKVLRHGYVIHLGRTRLVFWEIHISRVDADSAEVAHTCPLCLDPIAAGQEVIVCPRYPSVLHRECWFSTRFCPDNGCNYPNYEVIMDSLAAPPWYMRFERELDKGSKLVQDALFCTADQERDIVCFQPGDTIVYCPGYPPYGCNSPYHLQCWLELPSCPNCGFRVQDVLNDIFGTSFTVTVFLVR